MATNILTQLLDSGAPTKDIEIRIGSVSSATSDTFAYQDQHDNFQTNANLQVDDVDVGSGNPVPSQLVAGTASIGKLAANSGVDIGDVDVTSVVPGTGPSNLGKAEDSEHASGDVGVMALAVRNDALEGLAGADGDYTPLQTNANGALFCVLAEGSASIDIGDVEVTSTTPGTAATNLGKAVANVPGATDTGVAMLAVRDDSLATLAQADNTYTHLRVTSTGELHTSDATAAGYLDTISTNSTTLSGAVHSEDTAHVSEDSGIQVLAVRNDTLAALAADGAYAPLQVDASGALYTAVNGVTPGTDEANLGKAVAGSAGGSDTGVAMLAVRDDSLTTLTETDGLYTQLRVTSTGQLHVNDGAANTTLSSMLGDTAAISAAILTEDDTHFSGDAGIQTLAVRNDTLAALAGTDGDYAPLQVSAAGALYVSAARTNTVTEFYNDTVADTDSITQEVAIPAGVEAAHLYIDSVEAATFAFTLRHTSSGDQFTSASMADISVAAAEKTAHKLSDLAGVPYLVVAYTNSSGSPNALKLTLAYHVNN